MPDLVAMHVHLRTPAKCYNGGKYQLDRPHMCTLPEPRRLTHGAGNLHAYPGAAEN